MRHRSLLLALVFFTPALALAQYPGGMGGMGGMGRRGGMGGRGGERGGYGHAPDLPSGKDLEKKLDPVRLLLEKKKDLSLTDTQFTQLAAIEQKLHDENAPLYQQIDSLRNEMKSHAGGSGGPSDGERDGAYVGREAFRTALATVRDHDDAAAKEALAVLTDAQRAKAAELLEKQAKKAEDSTRGGERGGERGGWGGRRPH